MKLTDLHDDESLKTPLTMEFEMTVYEMTDKVMQQLGEGYRKTNISDTFGADGSMSSTFQIHRTYDSRYVSVFVTTAFACVTYMKGCKVKARNPELSSRNLMRIKQIVNFTRKHLRT